MADIILRGNHTSSHYSGYVWHILGNTGDYGGIKISGKVSIERDGNNVKVSTLKYDGVTGIVMKLVGASQTHYSVPHQVQLMVIPRVPGNKIKTANGKAKNGVVYDRNNKYIDDPAINSSIATANFGTSITFGGTTRTLSGSKKDLDGGKYYVCVFCGQDPCALGYANDGHSSAVIVGGPVSISPIVPATPSITVTNQMVGQEVTFTVQYNGNQVQYRYNKYSEKDNSWGGWSNWSDNWTSPKTLPTSVIENTKTRTAKITLNTNNSNDISRINLQVRTRNISSDNVATAWKSSEKVTTYKLYPPINLTPKGTLNTPILYGDSMLPVSTFTNDSRNPSYSSSNANLRGMTILPNNSCITGTTNPMYDNISYVRAKLHYGYFIDSDLSTNTIYKSRVKLRTPTQPILSLNNIELPSKNFGGTNYYLTTISNRIVSKSNIVTPSPNNTIVHYQWYDGASTNNIVSSTDSCIITNNNYHVKSYTTWKDSNGHKLLDSDLSTSSKLVLARRCPRGMTTDNNFKTQYNNDGTYKSGFNFVISRDGINYDDNYFNGSEDAPTSDNKVILTLDCGIYLKFPKFSADKHLGRFNYYKVEFVTADSNEIPIYSIEYNNDPEKAAINAPICSVADAVNNGFVVPGQTYRLKFTAGYYNKRDATLDTADSQYFWDASALATSAGISEDYYKDTNIFYVSDSNGHTVDILIGGMPEEPQLIYPSGSNYPTFNKSARIIFKVYNPEYLIGMPMFNINKIYVTVAGVTYTGIIENTDTGLVYFNSTDSSNFSYIKQDIGYPRLTTIIDPDTQEEEIDPDDGEKWYEPLTEDGHIVYDPLPPNGEITTYSSGYIVVFNLPEDLLGNQTIQLSCENLYGIKSAITEFNFTIVNSDNITLDIGELIAQKTFDETEEISIVYSYLFRIIQSYSNFVSENTDENIKYILENPVLPNSYLHEIIEPDKVGTLDKFLYSWYKAICTIYKEVYRKCYAASRLVSNILQKSDTLTISKFNPTAYNNMIYNTEGIRLFIYHNDYWYESSYPLYKEIKDENPEGIFTEDNTIKPEFLTGVRGLCNTIAYSTKMEHTLENYGIYSEGAQEGSYCIIVTSETQSISIGSVYPKEEIIGSILMHRSDLIEATNEEIYAHYSNVESYRGGLFGLIVDLLKTLI